MYDGSDAVRWTEKEFFYFLYRISDTAMARNGVVGRRARISFIYEANEKE